MGSLAIGYSEEEGKGRWMLYLSLPSWLRSSPTVFCVECQKPQSSCDKICGLSVCVWSEAWELQVRWDLPYPPSYPILSLYHALLLLDCQFAPGQAHTLYNIPPPHPLPPQQKPMKSEIYVDWCLLRYCTYVRTWRVCLCWYASNIW